MLYLDLRLTVLQNILVASLTPIWVKITDFGISKRWVGTSLKTQCGTAIYRSPEQLGILPSEFRISGNSYTNNIDIWAVGAIVHEMLTLEIPFLEGPIDNANRFSGFTSCLSVAEATVDTGLLYGYCHGKEPFPSASLRSHGVPEDGIQFVKSLMAVNPSKRLSAAAALACEWLVQTNCPASSDLVLPARPPVAASLASPEPPAEKEEKPTVVNPSRVPYPFRTEENKQAVVDPATFSETPAPKNEIHVVINSRRIPASPSTETEEPTTDLPTYPTPPAPTEEKQAVIGSPHAPEPLPTDAKRQLSVREVNLYNHIRPLSTASSFVKKTSPLIDIPMPTSTSTPAGLRSNVSPSAKQLSSIVRGPQSRMMAPRKRMNPPATGERLSELSPDSGYLPYARP